MDVRIEERRESLTCDSDSLTESLSEKSDVHVSEPTLFENYHCGKLSLHLHFSAIIRDGNRADWCLEMHRLRKVFGLDIEFPLLLEGDNIAWSRTSCQSGYMDFPVFVIICEAAQSKKPGIHRVSPTFVRLQSLNDCDCLKRNPIEGIGTNFVIEGTMISDERKLMTRLSGFAVVVSPVEFANKVVQTRISGLDNIAKDMGDFGGRARDGIEVSPSQGLRFVISLDEELSVFRIDIPNHSLIEGIEMMACPFDFLKNGFDAHAPS